MTMHATIPEHTASELRALLLLQGYLTDSDLDTRGVKVTCVGLDALDNAGIRIRWQRNGDHGIWVPEDES